MEPMLEGLKVVELAEWAFVPSAGAVLADWGADVVKIEHPIRGDALRGLRLPGGADDFNHMVEQMNRGKRSIGLDVAKPDGRQILLDLVADADVFVTSFREPARAKLRLTYEDLKAVNPRLVYARGHGQGPRGPDADKPGFDGHTWWARGGVTHLLSPGEVPSVAGRPAFGDVITGMFLAGGIAAALVRRSISGKGGLVDVSLLNSATWILAPDLVSSFMAGQDPPKAGQGAPMIFNPLIGMHKTSDDRYITLMMLQADRYWPGFCRALDRKDLIEDPRFNGMEPRVRNGKELVEIISQAFAAAPLEEWKERLDREDCVFAPMQTPLEVANDPQTLANDYMPRLLSHPRARLSASPVQYNGEPVEFSGAAPELGQHTEAILLDLGRDWDEIERLKREKVIG